MIVRRRLAPGAPEQMVLDIERLAAGHEQYSLDNYVVSPDDNRVAFAVDLTGAIDRIAFLCATSRPAGSSTRESRTPRPIWRSRLISETLLYIRVEPDTCDRTSCEVIVIGAGLSRDTLMYEDGRSVS